MAAHALVPWLSSARTLQGARLSPRGHGLNKMPHTVACKQQEFLSHISGGWKSEIRLPVGVGPVRALFWVADFSLYPPLEERARGLCGVSFIRHKSHS